MKRKNQLRLSIKTKMLTAFLALSLVSLAAFGVLALDGINSLNSYSLQRNRALGDSAVSDSTLALELQAEDNLLRLAKDQADISNNVFERVQSEMQIIAQLATQLLERDSLPTKPLYSQEQKPSNVNSTSIYLLAPNVNIESVRTELNYTSNLQDVFKTVYSNDPLIAQVYVGTSSGIMQIYPWTSGISSSFDPRLRGWYINASRTGELCWSEPYIDAGGLGLMVTCSIPITTPQRGYFWVVAADVTIETINRNIINTQVGELGYSFLLDSEGGVIALPGLTSGAQQWNESYVIYNMLNSGNRELDAVAKNMTLGITGVTMCNFVDGDKFIAYAPLNSTKWSVAIVAPINEIIAPALSTRDKIIESADSASDYITREAEAFRNTFVGVFGVIFVVVIIISLLLSRMIVTPIMTLMKGAKTIGSGNLDSRVKVTSGDELEALAASFNKMADDLQGHIAELQRTTAEKERLMKELEIAKGIQQSFLPEKTPHILGIDLAASNVPAREVGGDFYDFIPVGSHKWGLTIADVSGKGVPAALFMALSRTLVRASATGNPNVDEAIEKSNDLICADSKTGMFVTLFYAILDETNRRLKYVNAGHNPPLLLRQPSGKTVLLKADGIALGVLNGIKLEEAEITLETGDLLVLYTDGVTEAINDKEELFGQERMLRIIEENRCLPAKEIVRKIEDAVTAFSGGQPQFDDITLMILKVT